MVVQSQSSSRVSIGDCLLLMSDENAKILPDEAEKRTILSR